MKTSELTGIALDWAVAIAAGVKVRWSAPHEMLLRVGKAWAPYTPSTNWAQAGPIIEQEKMNINSSAMIGPNQWVGIPRARLEGLPYTWYGPTPLIAAMRCYVASELGDYVELPKEIKEALK